MNKCRDLIVFFLFTVHTTTALFFYIGEKERKCFVEEVPDATSIIIIYKADLFDPTNGGYMPVTPGIGMHVHVTDPDDKIMFSLVYNSEGRKWFTLNTPGKHVICMFSNSTAQSGKSQLRVHIDTQVEDDITYYNFIQKEKLVELQLRIHQLFHRMDNITNEQNRQRYQEGRFRKTSASTNCLVLWWSIAQTAILIIMGVCQSICLKPNKIGVSDKVQAQEINNSKY